VNSHNLNKVKILPNVTISVPADVYEKMKKHPEIRWSVIITKFLREYLKKLEMKHEISSHELLEELGIKEDLESIPDSLAVSYGLAMVRKRGKRIIRH